MIHLRDYQVQALEAERRHRAETPEENRLAIVLPTGTGKAIIIAERAKRFMDAQACDHGDLIEGAGCWDCRNTGIAGNPRRVLIIVDTEELVDQLYATVCLVVGTAWPVGIVKAERDDITADIIVASRQTLERPERRARIADVGLVIVDECHVGHTAYVPILRHFGCMPLTPYLGNRAEVRGDSLVQLPTIPALGFTATLERSDGAGLGSVWHDVAFTRDTSWAIRKGYLVQPIGYRLEIGGVDYFSSNPGLQDMQIADGIAPERIVEKWQELAADRQTIVFAPLVRSARRILHTFRDAGIKAEMIHGDMPTGQRRAYIERFRRGDVQVLCNAMVLTKGFDHPNIGCVVVARPTKSRSLFIQMAGRGLRPVPGIPVEDQNCILITLADATTDLCSVADLSDRPIDRKADGPLTVMEDQWDIGRDLEETARHWTGKVDVTRFDPIVAARSKVWARTKGGHWFLPISKDREYVFLLDGPDGNTDIYVLTRLLAEPLRVRADRVQSVPDRELAFSLAEDEATERGGDVGALLADRTRAWRKGKPGDKMLDYARRLGLGDEVDRIMSATAGGKAGKLSDLIRRVEASCSIDKAAQQIRERQS
jgi:superfamily II DNA or RNA helicase